MDDDAQVPKEQIILVAESSSLTSASGRAPKFLFVLGAPRSGTSWLQKCLAQQPGWVTVPELHYAAEVLRPVLKAWDRKTARLEEVLTTLEKTGRQPDRVIGMPASLEFDDLVRMLREPFEVLVERGSRAYGEVDVFIEKTPSNSILTSYLSQVFPDGYMLHVVRDPRAVVRSLRSASAGWGVGWAPRSVLVCALIWRSYAGGARRAADRADHYLEVRYEDAQGTLPKELSRIRDWIGASALDLQCVPLEGVRHEVVSTRVAQSLGSGEVGEPEGFGDGSITRPELSRRQRWMVEFLTARLMAEFGYTVQSRTAKWLNRSFEAACDRLVAGVSQRRREELVLNLPLLRLPRRGRSSRSL